MGFGAVEKEQSPTDFELGAVTFDVQIPETFMPEYNFEIQMQGKQPCCGACSGSALKNIQDTTDTSFTYLWKKIKVFDGFSVDSGTSLDSIMKALNKSGVCHADLLKGDISLPTATFAQNTGITSEMETDALKHRVGAYAFTWNPSFEQIKQAIYKHKAVILLMRIGEEFWTPSWSEKDIMPLKPGKSIVSGHFVVAFGYDSDYILL